MQRWHYHWNDKGRRTTITEDNHRNARIDMDRREKTAWIIQSLNLPNTQKIAILEKRYKILGQVLRNSKLKTDTTIYNNERIMCVRERQKILISMRYCRRNSNWRSYWSKLKKENMKNRNYKSAKEKLTENM